MDSRIDMGSAHTGRCLLKLARGWIAALALCLLSGTQAADFDEEKRDAITGIVFDSAITLRAKERQASKELRELYDRLAALHGSVLSDAEKHRREIALKDRILRKLEAADRVYAEQIGAFKGSLHALSRTPEATRILRQYQSGEKRAALAALATLIATRQQARQAATQQVYVADLRAEAALVLDAADKGEVEVGYAMAKLELLAVEERENWRTWLTLYRFYFTDAQYEQARRCLEQAKQILQTKESSVTIFGTFADLEMNIHDIRESAVAKGVRFKQLEEFRRHHLDYLISIENDEAEVLLTHLVLGESLERLTAPTERSMARMLKEEGIETTIQLNEARAMPPRAALETELLAQGVPAGGGALCAALARTPSERTRADAPTEAAQAPRDLFLNFALEDSVREACRLHREQPSSTLYSRHLAFVFERLGQLYDEANDRPMASILYAEAHAIDQALLIEHPTSLDLRRNLATSLFNLALAEQIPARWAQACTYLETMQGDGRLLRRDQPYREAACRRAMPTAQP